MGKIGALLFFMSILNNFAQNDDLLDYVDPFIGTDGIGHTFPGATTPFGMVQLSPSNDFKGWNWSSGYHSSDTVLKGFAHTHLSGTGLAGLGDILLMPTTGIPKIHPGTEDNPDLGYRSRFSKETENASTGYYSVMLDDYKIKVELTASPRCGIHRYTFPQSNRSNIIVDPTHSILEGVKETYIKKISDTEVIGYKLSFGEGGKRKTHFIIQFSHPIVEAGFYDGENKIDNTIELTKKNAKAYFSFDTKKETVVEAKVAISFVSFEGARKNLDTETTGKSFDDIHKEARNSWEKVLSKIHIEGTEKQKRIFYTGLYHSYIAPNLISDVDGKYIINEKIYDSQITQYSTYSTWDTFRALHPLLNIIETKYNTEFVNSLISRHTESKVGLPIWELCGFDNKCMIGHNTVPVIADAIMKDLPGIDYDSALEAMVDAANNNDKSSNNYGVNNYKEYSTLGYIPSSSSHSVSKALEYAYFDWTIYMVAKKLGKKEIVENFLKRSKTYINYFNKEKKFFWPKTLTGKWIDIDFSTWDDLVSNYVSGNIWAYASFVPHAIPHLVELQGGKDEYIKWMDGIITDTTQIGGHQHVDISGFIGKYGHGDEPGHHFPYLFNYGGQPWKTQELVRKVMNDFYSDDRDGLVNNEDCGQMSAWYIFSSMGFYPVCPGDNKYIIGSPIIKSGVINLENGNKFIIKTINNSDENLYIKSVKLNGKSLKRSFIYHNEIMNGGEMVFEMDNKPNKTWASSEEHFPDYNDQNKIQGGFGPFSITTLPVFDLEERQIFHDELIIHLRTNDNSSKIYYSLDGSEPNKSSIKYNDGIKITDNSTLKAIAYSDNLPPSLVFEKNYFSSITANDYNRPIILNFPMSERHYGEKDGSQLIDSELGGLSYSDGKWTGLLGKDIDVTLQLKNEQKIKNVTVSYLGHTPSWIFPPLGVTVYGGNDLSNLKELGSQGFQLVESEIRNDLGKIKISFEQQKIKYLKVLVKNTMILPDWHQGSGKEAWVFVDEIIIN